MAAGGLMTGGYPSDVSSDLDFFRQSHLSVSKLPSLKDKRKTIDSAAGGKKNNNKGTFPRTAERSHTYWRIFQVLIISFITKLLNGGTKNKDFRTNFNSYRLNCLNVYIKLSF